MVDWKFLILTLIVGIIIGWSAKSAWIINQVNVIPTRDNAWLVRFGPRIVYRTKAWEVAKQQRDRLVATIKGRRKP